MKNQYQATLSYLGGWQLTYKKKEGLYYNFFHTLDNRIRNIVPIFIIKYDY